MHIEEGGNCECLFCKNKISVEIPEELINAVKNDNLIIFAGAGVSTESSAIYGYTLYQEVCNELSNTENLSFSQLMSKYCELPDGRAKLLRKIKKRFDYFASFPELERRASSFHRELATLFHIRNIITTNWDDYFERYCGAIPIVFPEDYVFWNLPERKVIKIHGSINNLGSIVATEEDYDKCYRRLNSGLIGSSLKTLLATKYVLFIGYSFSDEDFMRVYNSLMKEMKGLIPHAYIVTLDSASKEKFKNINVTPIITDATYFITSIKKSLYSEKHFLHDDIYDKVSLLLFKVEYEHKRLSEELEINKYPEVIFALNYQDGLIHAFERILAYKKTGYYSHTCNIYCTLDEYHNWRKIKLKKRVYEDVAYIDGYMDGLNSLISDTVIEEHFNLYYLFGYDFVIETLEEFKELIQTSNKLHKSSYMYAKKNGSYT